MTHLLKRLNLRIPLIQAPMAGVSTPHMAGEVCRAGGLGSIAVGHETVPRAREAIRYLKSATINTSFNVNVFAHKPPVRDVGKESAWLDALSPAFKEVGAQAPTALDEIYISINDNPEMVQLLVDEAPPVVSFHFGIPKRDIIQRLHSRDIFLIGCATSVSEAVDLQGAGMDAVVAQGYEAGGHRGRFDDSIEVDEQLGTMALVPQVVDALGPQFPVIAAGGIADGRSVAAALMLGACAAQIGTAFVPTVESQASDSYKRIFLSQRASHTEMTSGISGRAARGIRNRLMDLLDNVSVSPAPYPVAYHAAKALAKAGGVEFSALWAGQSASRCRRTSSKEIVDEIGAFLRSQGLL